MSLPPMLADLVDMVPSVEDGWPEADRYRWVRAFEAVAALIYSGAPAERPAPATTPPEVEPPPIGPKVWTCEKCGETFTTGQGLGAHRRHRKCSAPSAHVDGRATTTADEPDLEQVATLIRTRPAGIKPWQHIARTYDITEAAARRLVVAARDAGLLPAVIGAGPMTTTPFDPDAARARAAGAVGDNG